ncbi:type IV secretion system protein [Bartonella tribocorum]|uniref:Conjugal transfer protein n=1 Tax=Bartonella tribocorum TaxID=85701 RepID=A0A2M6USG8_9HYPH|nr:type IV secretion system protein [Bartonella tribocorum]PIT69121.1 conjugal transfer protein [Bartonella tribocorum]
MKKQVISIAAAMILGISKPAMAIWGAGAADLRASVPTLPSLSSIFGSSSSNLSKPTPPQEKKIIIRPKDLIELAKKQLEETKKIHQSITGNRQLGIKNPTELLTDQSSFFLKNPEIIYNKGIHSAISQSFESILKEERTPDSLQESRDIIVKRIQYASFVDKAVSLQAFQETKNRFEYIEKLLSEIKKTQDLKSIAELQSHIMGTLAMIQNETTKLYMVAHLRNAEQSLIRQQKDKHNVRILNSKNTQIPTIKFIR